MNFQQNITPIPGTKHVEYTCIECGIKKKTYASHTNKKQYCSTKCSGAARTRMYTEKQISLIPHMIKCEICPQQFEFKSTHPHQKFCSKRCAKITNFVTEPIRNCLFCETSFLVTSNNNDKKYCCVSCSNRHRNTGKTLIQLKDNISVQRKANTELLNAVAPDKLKNAQFITESNTESTITVKKSDVYKFICKTCDKTVIRYLSRGKPVPRFCSKKCTRWLGDIDRKPRETSSRTITHETYAQTEQSLIKKYTPNINTAQSLLCIIQVIIILFLLSYGANLFAFDMNTTHGLKKSKAYQDLRRTFLIEYVQRSCETDIALPVKRFSKPPQRQPSPLAVLAADEK